MIEVKQKITGFSVVKPNDEGEKPPQTSVPASSTKESDAPASNVVRMSETVGRPETLAGTTYRVKTPLFEHALYVTINDIVLNEGTEHQERRPFEIFVNSKNMDNFQWIVALTRIMSAVFRKGGDVTFLIEELKAVFDPRGGYFKGGGVFMPSVVAELGWVLETHLRDIGLIEKAELSDAQKALIAEKRAAVEASVAEREPTMHEKDAESNFPASATVCPKCSVKAVVMADGCMSCLNCAYSRCGS